MKHYLKRIFISPVFITCLAFALRMIFLNHLWRIARPPVKDNVPYGYELGRVARSIALGKGFSSPLNMGDTGPTIWFTPIYPYLIAGIFKLWGIYSDLSHIIIETMNCAFASLTTIPVRAAAKRSFGTGVATGAAWAWFFLPTAVYFPYTWVWDTSLTALLFALIFWATLALREARGVLPWAGYGALWVFGGLVNPSILSLFPFFLGWLIWKSRNESTSWARRGAVALLVFSIGLVPWTIRNYRVFGKFVVLRSNFGLELWLGNSPGVADTVAQWAHPNDNPEEGEKYKRMGEMAYMAEKQHEAFAFMRTHPRDTLYLMYHRFTDTWLGVTDSPWDSWRYGNLFLKALLLLNVLLSLFCLWGALYAYRARHPDAVPYALVLLVFPLVFYLTHSSPRYRFPMDPIMIILAASGVAQVISLARARNARATSAPASSLPINLNSEIE